MGDGAGPGPGWSKLGPAEATGGSPLRVTRSLESDSPWAIRPTDSVVQRACILSPTQRGQEWCTPSRAARASCPVAHWLRAAARAQGNNAAAFILSSTWSSALDRTIVHCVGSLGTGARRRTPCSQSRMKRRFPRLCTQGDTRQRDAGRTRARTGAHRWFKGKRRTTNFSEPCAAVQTKQYEKEQSIQARLAQQNWSQRRETHRQKLAERDTPTTSLASGENSSRRQSSEYIPRLRALCGTISARGEGLNTRGDTARKDSSVELLGFPYLSVRDAARNLSHRITVCKGNAPTSNDAWLLHVQRLCGTGRHILRDWLLPRKRY